MEKQDLKKFVGLPYKFLGVDYHGVDCIGLCQLFYQEHGIDLDGATADRSPKTGMCTNHIDWRGLCISTLHASKMSMPCSTAI